MSKFSDFNVVNFNPLVAYCDDFVAKEDVAAALESVRVLDYADARVTDLSERKKEKFVDLTVRSAKQAKPAQETLEILAPVRKRVVDLFSLPESLCEEPAVLRYDVGEEYKAHYDAAAEPANPAYSRIYTALLYLNDDFTGGTTTFHRLKLEIEPKAGRLLVWGNQTNGYPRPHPLALHSGNPVASGTKHIVTFWIHGAMHGNQRA